MKRSLVLVGAIGSASVASLGQNLVPTEMTGQPLQYMKDGAVFGCGVRIIAGRPLTGQTFEFSEVSINLYASGAALVKGVAYKATTGATMSAPAQDVVKAAWVKAPGAAATVPIGKTSTADDGKSLLFQTSLDSALAIFRAQADGRQIQLAVQRAGKPTETILSGVVALSSTEQQQMTDCMTELTSSLKTK